jgi:16S rRNA G966 N2-methylase RsmD
MKNILIILSFFLMIGCCASKHAIEVPVKEIVKIEYRDSLIHVKDTIYIQPPVEEKSNKTKEDSSHLETSMAKSDAWIDVEGNLNHTLENKDTPLKTIRDTIFVTQNVIEYKEKEVPVEVEIPKPYIPIIFWIAMCYMVLSLGLKIYKLISKLL